MSAHGNVGRFRSRLLWRHQNYQIVQWPNESHRWGWPPIGIVPFDRSTGRHVQHAHTFSAMSRALSEFGTIAARFAHWRRMFSVNCGTTAGNCADGGLKFSHDDTKTAKCKHCLFVWQVTVHLLTIFIYFFRCHRLPCPWVVLCHRDRNPCNRRVRQYSIRRQRRWKYRESELRRRWVHLESTDCVQFVNICYLQLPDGVVEVTYPDGSRLSVIQPDQGGGITYTHTNGIQSHYTATDSLPETVRDRLKQIPIVIKHLMAHNVNSYQNSPILSPAGTYPCTPVSRKCLQPPIASAPNMRYFRWWGLFRRHEKNL